MANRPLLVLVVALAACGGGSTGAPPPQCSRPSDCGADLPCRVRTCTAGACGTSDLTAGTVVIAQVSGDCRENRCDGAGGVTSVALDSDLPPDDGNPCTREACQGGVASHPPHTAGTACPTGTCDGNGVCLDACQAGPNPCTAPPPAACQGSILLTYAAPGTCSASGAPPGFGCSYPPTSTDCAASGAVCQGGACVPQADVTSAQLAAVRDAGLACGTPPCAAVLPVDSAIVTYVRPQLGVDAAGFYVQARQTGPALLLLVDPATLSPSPVAGDQASFTVTQVAPLQGDGVVAALSGFGRVGQGAAIAPLVQDLTAASDLVTGLGGYADELVVLSGSLAGPAVAAGAGFVALPLSTPGVPADPNLVLRATTAVADVFELAPQCQLTVAATPLGVRNGEAQVTVRTTAEVTALSCPAPKVLAAQAMTSTSVTIAVDRSIAPGSVLANGSQFTVSGGLAVTAAAGSGRAVELTTSTQAGGASYTVTVAGSVTDTLGSAVDAAANAATFTGFACTSSVVALSQVYAAGGNTGAVYANDFVELHNRSAGPVSLAGWSLQYASGAGTTWAVAPLSGTIAAGGYFLVQLPGGGLGGSALPAPDLVSTGFNAGASSGKVALVSQATPLAANACPTGGGVVDFVGYGTASCAEGTAAPSGTAGTSILRLGSGCLDTQSNVADFTAGAPAPRNSAASPLGCSCP